MTSNKSHADLQELSACEDAGTKLYNINLSTSDEEIEDNVEKSSMKMMKEINCKHDDHKGIRL